MSESETMPASEVTGLQDVLDTQAYRERVYASYYAFLADQELRESLDPTFWNEIRDSIISEITSTSKRLHAIDKKGIGRVAAKSLRSQK